MKTLSEINEAILDKEKTIRTKYPELTKYLNELPITIPNEVNPIINFTTLHEYYSTLNEIILTYSHEKL